MEALYGALILRGVFEEALLGFLVCKLRGIKAKYSINLELRNITLTWAIQWITFITIQGIPFSLESSH